MQFSEVKQKKDSQVFERKWRKRAGSHFYYIIVVKVQCFQGSQ